IVKQIKLRYALTVKITKHYPGLLVSMPTGGLPGLSRMVRQFRQGFCLSNAYTNSKHCVLKNFVFQFPSELMQITTVADASQVAKSLIDAVYLHPWAELFRRSHYALAHIPIKGIVRTEADNPTTPELLLHFEIRLTH